MKLASSSVFLFIILILKAVLQNFKNWFDEDRRGGTVILATICCGWTPRTAVGPASVRKRRSPENAGEAPEVHS